MKLNRRSLFRKLGALVAAVAVAPEIAFRTRLEFPTVSEPVPQYYSVDVNGTTVELYVFNKALSDKQCRDFDKILIKKYDL